MDKEKIIQAIKNETYNIDERNGYFYVIGLINMAFLCKAITIEEHFRFTKEAILKLEIAERNK